MAISSSDDIVSVSMASTVSGPLPSKKQEHLVAGRRKLEEYRKKKAGERKAGADRRKNNKNDLTYEESSKLATGQRLLQTRSEISSVEVDDAMLFNGNVQSNGETCGVSGERFPETQMPSGKILPGVDYSWPGSEDDQWHKVKGPLQQVNREWLGLDSSSEFRNAPSELEIGKLNLQGNSLYSDASYSQTLLEVAVPVPSLDPSSLSQDTSETVSSVYKSGHVVDADKDSLLSSLDVQQAAIFGASGSLGEKDFGNHKFVSHSSYGDFNYIGKLAELSEQSIASRIEDSAGGDGGTAKLLGDEVLSTRQENQFECLHDSEVGSVSVIDQKQAASSMPDVVPSHACLLRDYEPGLTLNKKHYLSDVTYTISDSEEIKHFSKLNIYQDKLGPQLLPFKTSSHLLDIEAESSLKGMSEAKLLPLSSNFATQNANPQFVLPLPVSTFSLMSSMPRSIPLSSASLPVPNKFSSSTAQTSVNTLSLSSSTQRHVPVSSTFLPSTYSFALSTPQASATSLELAVTDSGKAESVSLSAPLSSSLVGSLNGELISLEDFASQKWSQKKHRPSERDDFAALEQHIEDLTQEKFSLRHALDVARSLTESLASENSSLTQDFNQQGVIINQLKSDLERQDEEIQAQVLVLSSFREAMERAQQESNSALERSQILAAEIIALEEKVLKLRSSELKLQRDLESLKVEHDSCKRHSSSLEKDRIHLSSMIEALQEEKRLLQKQFHKGGFLEPDMSGKRSVDLRDQKDASTSTIDFVEIPLPSYLGESQATASALWYELPLHALPSTEQNATDIMPITHSHCIQSLSKVPSPSSVPSDQLRTIENINSLITEFGNERDWTMERLEIEIKETAKLRALNAELSQKLEMQTQRLELAIAQNIAHGVLPVGMTVREESHDEVEYLDEGDEVVERVLGWIMKLFPGGSSKRQSSKLL